MRPILLIAIFLGIIVIRASTYVLPEWEQVISPSSVSRLAMP